MTETGTRRRALWVAVPAGPGRPRRGARWWWLAVAAGLLALCHGCHGEDVDDELCGRGWWVVSQIFK